MNETKSTAFNWQAAIEQTFDEFSTELIGHVPQILGALALIVIGWLTALLLRLATRKLVSGLDSLFVRFARYEGIRHERIRRSYEMIASQIVFWVVLVFFLAASANLLGWNLLTGWMNSLVTFLPSLITGLLIILAGFLISNAARTAILSAAPSTGIAQSTLLARIAQFVILFSFVIIGIEQIGLNVHFLTRIIVVVIGVLLLGAALAFGFGARTMVANIIGAQHTRKHCRVGDILTIGEYKGEILEVTQTAIILDASQGRAMIPAKLFHEQVMLLNPENRVADDETGKDDA